MSRFHLLAPDASPAPSPIPTFWQKFNHAGCSPYFPVYCYLYSSHLLIRGAPFYAVLPFQQPYILWEPLFTCPGVPINPFCHPPSQLAPLAFIWQQLIIFILSLNFPLCHFYLKPCVALNASLEFLERSHPPITVSILHQIYLVLQPFRSMDMDSSMLWAAFTVALFGILRSSEFTCSDTFDTRIHLIRWDGSFYPDLLRPDYFETSVKSLKRTPSGRQPSTL